MALYFECRINKKRTPFFLAILPTGLVLLLKFYLNNPIGCLVMS